MMQARNAHREEAGGDRFPILQFRMLGPLEVLHEGEPIALGGPRDRALLALLVANAGKVVSSERLIEALWGDDLPGDPQHALQAAVSRLRKALQVGLGTREFLVRRPPGYLLDIEPEWVDAARFERLVDAARRRQDAASRSAALQEALGLWRGPALTDVAYEPWAQEEITRLEEVRLGAVEDEVDAELAAGRHAELLGRLRALVKEHPLRERLPAQLMLALYRAGRQAEALEGYEETRSVLAEELGIDPAPELRRLHQDILRQDPSLQWVPPAPLRTNLPERLTSFVGREEETKQVSTLLVDNRLVTLTGAGGSGKTRLAVEVGAALADGYREGVWLVDLAPVTDVRLVPQTVATALQVPEDPVRALADTLVDFLRPKQLLLILDNCEHLVEAAADLANTLISAASDITILATSREPLGVPGEMVLQISPLPVPGAVTADAGPEAVLQYDAIRLFVDRATAAQPGFTLTHDNVRPIVEICSRLEGLPLALELAAARVRGLGVEALAARLSDQFRLLAGARRARLPKERSFRAAVDWSYDLLGEQERRVFERLSVFAGAFGLDAAEAVASGEAVTARDVSDLVARLVDRSLVHLTGDSPLRYRLLEPLRQYGRERLETRGETSSARRRHMGFYLALAEAAEPALRGREQRSWLHRLEEEHDNLRTALSTASELGDADAGLRLAAALGPFWQMRGRFGEGRERLRRALSSSRQDAPSRARALVEAGFLAFLQCDYHDTMALAEEALDRYRQAGDRWGIAYALAGLGLAVWKLGDTDRARASFDESLRLFRDLDDGWGVATTLGCLGFMAVGEGSLDEAEAVHDESLGWFREQGDSSRVGMALGYLGDLAVLRGELDRADERLRESLELAEEIGDRWGTARALASLARTALLRSRDRDAADLYGRALRTLGDLGDREDMSVCLEGIAELASRRGSQRRAAELLGAAEVLRGVGTPFSLPSVDPAGYEGRVAALRSQLGTEQFASSWARGRSMTLNQVCLLALSPDPEER